MKAAERRILRKLKRRQDRQLRVLRRELLASCGVIVKTGDDHAIDGDGTRTGRRLVMPRGPEFQSEMLGEPVARKPQTAPPPVATEPMEDRLGVKRVREARRTYPCMRPCLACKGDFKSASPTHRLCQRCARPEEGAAI